DPNRPLPERNADALVSVCEFFCDHHDKPAARRRRPHVALVLDAGSGDAETITGHRVDPRGLETVLCDASIQRVLRAGPVVLDYGTTTSTISIPLWNATAVRDRGCRFPGCDRP